MEQIKANIIETVRFLSGTIGQRSWMDLDKLAASADFIERRMRKDGCSTEQQHFPFRNNTYANIITEITGTDPDCQELLIVGAHYDSCEGTPGADDNASGVAGLLELARLTREKPLKRTVRYVAFCLEEPPAYMTKHMGSYVHAESLQNEGAKVFGMISLEMLGYYCEDKGSQYYPSSLFKPFFPGIGNFIAFVGNFSSRNFSNTVKSAFTSVSSFPVESLNGFSIIPGVDFSDHRNYWKFGYPGFMITDTAFYRNPNYHDPGDLPDTLDYDRLATLTKALYETLRIV
ncbi:MAG: M28 family peptidase [Nitrospirota bacterium]|nr:M28 family peptidase [Nitrospirota bacterium]